MADIAKENKVTGTKWAKAAGIEQSRISEYKRMAKQTKAGATEPAGEREVTGYIFSLNTLFTLWDGLRRLVGATALRRGLITHLETKKVSTGVRIFMRLMIFTDGHRQHVFRRPVDGGGLRHSTLFAVALTLN